METKQPKWRRVANLGDVNPVEYGGYFIDVDETGVYPPEATYLDAPEDEPEDATSEAWTAYRFILEPCTYVDGVLSDNPFHPDHAAWFAESLDAVASCVGRDVAEIRADLCGADPCRRADAYRDIASYHGWDNFDSYPVRLTRADAERLANR